jgi:hypothetical protein
MRISFIFLIHLAVCYQLYKRNANHLTLVFQYYVTFSYKLYDVFDNLGVFESSKFDGLAKTSNIQFKMLQS